MRDVTGPASAPSISSALIGVTGPRPGCPQHNVVLQEELRVEHLARLVGIEEGWARAHPQDVVANLRAVHMFIQRHALALDKGCRWMGKPLRHVLLDIGPIHLVCGNIKLQKCPIWWLLFHLIGAAGSSHGVRGNQVCEKFSKSKVQRGHLYQNDPRARLNSKHESSSQMIQQKSGKGHLFTEVS